jgi:hypothetical protein
MVAIEEDVDEVLNESRSHSPVIFWAGTTVED